MATGSEVLTILQEVESVSNSVLAEVSALDPALDLPVALVSALEGLANTALSAWQKASGTPVTVAAAQAETVTETIQPPA